MILLFVKISLPAALAPFLASSNTFKLWLNPARLSRTNGVHLSTVSTLWAKTSRPEEATVWITLTPFVAKSGVSASTRMLGAFCLILDMVEAIWAAPPSTRSKKPPIEKKRKKKSQLIHKIPIKKRKKEVKRTIPIDTCQYNVTQTPSADRFRSVFRLVDVQRRRCPRGLYRAKSTSSCTLIAHQLVPQKINHQLLQSSNDNDD